MHDLFGFSFLGIERCETQNPFILKIIEIYKRLFGSLRVSFTWIRSHICIHGNTVIDQEAKNALDISQYPIVLFRILPFIMNYI